MGYNVELNERPVSNDFDLGQKFVVLESDVVANSEVDSTQRLSLKDTETGGPAIDATFESAKQLNNTLFGYESLCPVPQEEILPRGGWKSPTISRPFSNLSFSKDDTWESGCSPTPPVTSKSETLQKEDANERGEAVVPVPPASPSPKVDAIVEFHLKRKGLLEELERQRNMMLKTTKIEHTMPNPQEHDSTVEVPTTAPARTVSTRKMQLLARSNPTGISSVKNDFIFKQVDNIISEVDSQNQKLITGRDATHERIYSFVVAILKTLTFMWLLDSTIYAIRHLISPEEEHSRLFSLKNAQEEIRRSSILKESGEYSDTECSMGTPLTKEDTKAMISSWLEGGESGQHQQL